MKDHPHLISLYNLYQNEVQSFRKVHRMIDLFESIIKSHTIVILGEYVRYNKLSDAAKGMLAQGLRTPSLGTWQEFSRVLFEELQAGNYSWTFAEFSADFIALKKKLKDTDVIAFRNSYAHGATPTDSQCLADIQKFEPFLNILHKSNWLSTTRIETRENKVWIVGDNEELCVHPLLVNKSDGGETPYAFFNDLKKDKVGLLNYPLSKHYREKDFLNEFYEYLPINEWKKSGNNEHHQHIEELTETFKGRTNEREKLLNFVSENNKGYCSIQGNPGIGKSALIAQFFKDMRAQKEITNVHVVEYFIRRGTIQSQNIEYMFNYLIRRTDEIFIQGKEIRAEGKDIWDLQQQIFAKWRLWGEQCAGKKLLFLIDGLDEGTENNIVKYLPRENFLGVLIIYGSRPGGHKSLKELWSQLPTENHTKLKLSGLSLEDIRALIYEVANKYELERESAWIDAVQKRSQGNPLYLKLLCDAIENGSIELNDIHALPNKIDEYYKAILSRYAADTLDGDALLAGLYTFAAARDYLTLAHIKFINKLGDATVHRIGSTLKEVLYENPLTETVLDYQLFHESFREYLVKEKAREVSDAAERIIDFCSTWQDHEGNWELRYCLQHYAAHATVSSRKARSSELLMLLANTEYIETQKKVLKHYDSTKELFQLCLLKASELKLYDPQLEAALRLIDLKYEEANDAPEVVALVASGNPVDLELALKRIESFGGADKEGVRRRFILYMLCLMELTLLGNKDAPFRKDTIEKLLKHLDEQIPEDNSIINWYEFFPSYTMFLMACECAELELDYLILFKRRANSTEIKKIYNKIGLEMQWVKQMGPYTDFQFDILIKYSITGNTEMDLCSELAKQGKMEQAIDLASCKFNKFSAFAYTYTCSLIEISRVLAKLDKLEESTSVLEQALEIARNISNINERVSALMDISSELAKKDKIEDFAIVTEQALDCVRGIDSDNGKCEALMVISVELAKQGKMRQSLEIAQTILKRDYKIRALKDISSELIKQDNKLEGASIMERAIGIAINISGENHKNISLKDISRELAKQGKMEQAREIARTISNEGEKDMTLEGISILLAKQGMFEQALEINRSIFYNHSKFKSLMGISNELAIQGKFEQALEIARTIFNDKYMIIALKNISSEFVKQGKMEEGACILEQSFEIGRNISNVIQMFSMLKDISSELAKQGKLEQAIECSRSLFSDSDKCGTLAVICCEFAKQGKIEKAIECARGIVSDRAKSSVLEVICCELAKQGKIEQAIECANGIVSVINKNSILNVISIELSKQGKIEQALESVESISNKIQKICTLMSIYNELTKQHKIEEAAFIMEKALEFARGMVSDSDKSRALGLISSELANQGKMDEATFVINQALDFTRGIVSDSDKSRALRLISSQLANQGKVDEATFLFEEAWKALEYAQYTPDTRLFKSYHLNEISIEFAKKGIFKQAIEIARNISDNYNKSGALKVISSELFKQSNWEFAEKIGFEITQLADRQSCWRSIAGVNYKEVGWQKSLQQVTCFKNDEARMFYLKGWVEEINLCEVNFECLLEALSIIANDSESIETLLQKHALHEVFLSNINTEKINQLNHSLNIQWMLDIANQFPNSNSKTRLSTNIETWLHEIVDEDDRERVELWAMKVAKGSMNEEEFKLKLEKISFI